MIFLAIGAEKIIARVLKHFRFSNLIFLVHVDKRSLK